MTTYKELMMTMMMTLHHFLCQMTMMMTPDGYDNLAVSVNDAIPCWGFSHQIEAVISIITKYYFNLLLLKRRLLLVLLYCIYSLFSL